MRELTAQVGSNRIQIFEDPKIDDLLVKYIDNCSKKTTITVYRIQIFSQSTQNVARINANNAKAKFLEHFPDVLVEVDWISPNWVVYAGKFRNRTDAIRLKKKIEYYFPNAFFVEQQIDYKEL